MTMQQQVLPLKKATLPPRAIYASRLSRIGVEASAPGWLMNARTKHERSSCGTQCSRISALRNFLTLRSILIGLDTKRAIGASVPTGMKNEQRTYS